MASPFASLLSRALSRVEKRLLAEYGAVFVTSATPPPVIIFSDGAEVDRFQSSLKVSRAILGQYEIELQSEAMDALGAAAGEAARRGGSITARAADSGRRSYRETVDLWERNVNRGLEHWVSLGRITPELDSRIRSLAPRQQVAFVLELEEAEQIYFGTFFDRSILHSVAAPGSSQHLSLLAFDVAEYADRAAEQVLAGHGWYRTVVNDLPHFTFLGRDEKYLADYGLKQVLRDSSGRSYSFWVPAVGL